MYDNPIVEAFERMLRQGQETTRAKEIRHITGLSYSEIYKMPKERPPKLAAWKSGKVVLFSVQSLIDHFSKAARMGV